MRQPSFAVVFLCGSIVALGSGVAVVAVAGSPCPDDGNVCLPFVIGCSTNIFCDQFVCISPEQLFFIALGHRSSSRHRANASYRGMELQYIGVKQALSCVIVNCGGQ